MTSTREQTVLPLQDNDLLESIRALLGGAGSVALLGDDQVAVELPERLRSLLLDVVDAMHRGQAITLSRLGERLTTQEAADQLGVSRPTLIKLLEAGKIPFETPGRHRRIRLSDLLTYQAVRREEQRQILQGLTRDAQDVGLYDEDPEKYQKALDEARARLA